MKPLVVNPLVNCLLSAGTKKIERKIAHVPDAGLLGRRLPRTARAAALRTRRFIRFGISPATTSTLDMHRIIHPANN